ncbi:hypothetical protein ABPG72_005171 [Tetrahymena utriculariae]
MSKIQYLQIASPYYNSDQFEVDLNPQQKGIVKFRIQPEGQGAYSYSYSYSNKFKLSKEDLIERILENQSNKIARKVNEKDSQLYFYSLFDNEECSLYYQNNTFNTFCEELNLKLINLESLDGIDTSKTINIKIPPQEAKLLKFKETNDKEVSSFKLSYAAYFE